MSKGESTSRQAIYEMQSVVDRLLLDHSAQAAAEFADDFVQSLIESGGIRVSGSEPIVEITEATRRVIIFAERILANDPEAISEMEHRLRERAKQPGAVTMEDSVNEISTKTGISKIMVRAQHLLLRRVLLENKSD